MEETNQSESHHVKSNQWVLYAIRALPIVTFRIYLLMTFHSRMKIEWTTKGNEAEFFTLAYPCSRYFMYFTRSSSAHLNPVKRQLTTFRAKPVVR